MTDIHGLQLFTHNSQSTAVAQAALVSPEAWGTFAAEAKEVQLTLSSGELPIALSFDAFV